jgi:hypothetical protein
MSPEFDTGIRHKELDDAHFSGNHKRRTVIKGIYEKAGVIVFSHPSPKSKDLISPFIVEETSQRLLYFFVPHQLNHFKGGFGIIKFRIKLNSRPLVILIK